MDKEVIKTAKAMAKLGFSARDIAFIIGMSHTSIHNYLNPLISLKYNINSLHCFFCNSSNNLIFKPSKNRQRNVCLMCSKEIRYGGEKRKMLLMTMKKKGGDLDE